MTGTLLPFAKGEKLFAELTLVQLSDQSLQKAAQANGTAVTEREHEWKEVVCDQTALQERKREARAAFLSDDWDTLATYRNLPLAV
jgi:hypothetical protein